jgi:hypothetical protein
MLARMSIVNLSRFVAIVLWSSLCVGQEVHVSRGNGTVALSVAAQKPYSLATGQEKLPTLTVECVHKGKKTGHTIAFSAGGALVEDTDMDAKGAQQIFKMTIGGTTQTTGWVPYGDTITYAYFAKTDAERVKFIQALLNSGKVSVEFKPFLTGAPTTSVFDLSKLRAEMDKSPECAMQ